MTNKIRVQIHYHDDEEGSIVMRVWHADGSVTDTTGTTAEWLRAARIIEHGQQQLIEKDQVDD